MYYTAFIALELERKSLMKKNRKILKILLLLAIVTYVIITLFNQQKTLNQYSQSKEELSKQIEEQNQYKEELSQTKENINSLEFIEKMAREKLDMYLPNEKVYIDKGM